MVNDPPETMDSDSLYERSPVTWRRSKIGRPGKEDGAMEVQPLNQKVHQYLLCQKSTHENRRACGDSLWSERKTRKPLKVRFP